MQKLGRGLAVLNCSVRSVECRLYRARQILIQWWEAER